MSCEGLADAKGAQGNRAVPEGEEARRGSGRCDWEKLPSVVKELMNDRPLKAKHRDHELSGEHAGVRECRIEPDWLLIDCKEGSVAAGALKLIRTGSHSELF